jgi:NCAIR mutase (PurE)-related protein
VTPDRPDPYDPHGIEDLGYARVDIGRAHRTGDPEVVFGQGKAPAEIVTILRTLNAAHPDRTILATRVDDDGLAAAGALPGARVDPVARCILLGPPPRADGGRVGIVAAGTSDSPVAREAEVTAAAFGATTTRIMDVGVAGLHRVMAVREDLDDADCLIVVAGMEGALPSVVGGLTGTPVVAVPTSVGYGASLGGVAALLAMLNSCAPGVVVVNIDNGFGAAVHAARVARAAAAGRG